MMVIFGPSTTTLGTPPSSARAADLFATQAGATPHLFGYDGCRLTHVHDQFRIIPAVGIQVSPTHECTRWLGGRDSDGGSIVPARAGNTEAAVQDARWTQWQTGSSPVDVEMLPQVVSSRFKHMAGNNNERPELRNLTVHGLDLANGNAQRIDTDPHE